MMADFGKHVLRYYNVKGWLKYLIFCQNKANGLNAKIVKINT